MTVAGANTHPHVHFSNGCFGTTERTRATDTFLDGFYRALPPIPAQAGAANGSQASVIAPGRHPPQARGGADPDRHDPGPKRIRGGTKPERRGDGDG
jgi:hypothetical protein